MLRLGVSHKSDCFAALAMTRFAALAMTAVDAVMTTAGLLAMMDCPDALIDDDLQVAFIMLGRDTDFDADESRSRLSYYLSLNQAETRRGRRSGD